MNSRGCLNRVERVVCTDDPVPQTDRPHEPHYEPPAIVYRAPLEVTAAFCAREEGGKTQTEFCFELLNS